MGEAIEQGSRHLCITSGRFPFNEASIGGGHDAGPFAELAQKMGQQRTPEALKGRKGPPSNLRVACSSAA